MRRNNHTFGSGGPLTASTTRMESADCLPKALRTPFLGQALLVCAATALLWGSVAVAVPAIIERPKQITEQDRQAAAKQAEARGFKAPMTEVGGGQFTGNRAGQTTQGVTHGNGTQGVSRGNGRKGVNHGN